MRTQENIPLAPLTTFKVGGPARYFVEAHSEHEVSEAVAYALARKLPLFVLGGGSNLVVSDDGWPGLVLRVSLAGVEFEGDRQKMLFHASAGENWDSPVALAVSKNCGGIECLSGIPGAVGGTPVQNVGAYGQEVSEAITRVRTLEIATGAVLDLSNADCGFSYRSSIFNGTRRGEFIVLEVSYRLCRDGGPRIEYADVKNFFAATNLENPTLQQVRDAVRSIRQSKAMLLVEGDQDCRSAGSFFKNPIVSAAEADRIQALAEKRVPGKSLPRYPAANGQVKLAAAWLVEQSGFSKGYSMGPVGISHKHTLAIVNRGGATAKDILALKDEIEKKVFDAWGVRLQPEPVFVGF
ncbi:MAG TPA: UDP-N-acetylmuramate dehydrogenase [Candidatus Limnocylindrales bacterium]|nr:UDP-N-acetylmuramate dehydrogenase [Candidatus Limnocylindrales bacterium]